MDHNSTFATLNDENRTFFPENGTNYQSRLFSFVNDALPVRIPLYGYAMPVLLVITIVANTLVVVVLAQRHMRTPTNIVLLAMAISDMMTMLVPSPWYFYIYTLGNYDRPLSPATACYAFYYMDEVIPGFFHAASIWLTLVLAGQRYIYVCHPTMARTWCTVPRVLRAILFVYLFAFTHQLSRFFDRVFENGEETKDNITTYGCFLSTAMWVQTTISIPVYFCLYFSIRAILFAFLPCAVLVLLNIFLFRALKRAQQKRKKLFQENRKSECKKLRDSNCTTMMLIVVVTVFLVVEIPMVVTIVIHVIMQLSGIQLLDYGTLNITIVVVNFFIMLSYPVNFAIYCGMSRQFRETFKDLFLMGTFINRREGSSRYSLVNGPRTSTNETIL